jgi:hypothetical protein
MTSSDFGMCGFSGKTNQNARKEFRTKDRKMLARDVGFFFWCCVCFVEYGA